MKFSAKNTLAAILAALLLLPSFVSCATEANEQAAQTTQAPGETIAEAETQDENYICELPDDLNYGKTEVSVLYVKKDGRADELPSERLGLGTVSDAVYERNIAVENRLSVKLNFVDEADDAAATTALKTMVQAGDDSVELSSIGSYYALDNAIQGMYLNLKDLSYVDTDKHYWSQEYNEITTFTSDNMQFLATSPAALSLFRLTYLTIYNRNLFAERNLPD